MATRQPTLTQTPPATPPGGTVDATQPTRPRRERGTRVRRRRVRAAWLFLTPMLVGLALVAGWPLARTFWFSVTDASLSSLEGANFIGLENYLVYDNGWYGILADPLWWQSVWNTLYFARCRWRRCWG